MTAPDPLKSRGACEDQGIRSSAFNPSLLYDDGLLKLPAAM
jgi:hypothetical protein